MQYLSSSLDIDKNSAQPVYLQLASQLMALINSGTLQSGQQLPASRTLAAQLGIHRKTIIRAYDELIVQGWLESKPGSGTFVATQLPKINQRTLGDCSALGKDALKHAGFAFVTMPHLQRELTLPDNGYHLDDGLPDARIAPLQELSSAYRSQMALGNPYSRLGYGDPAGAANLRTALSSYLNETRGMQTTAANVLITRGTVMSMYLACTVLLKQGDLVAVTDLSWSGADVNFKQAGARMIRIPTDEAGIDINALEATCKKMPIRMLYITSHHHYPTTVSLRADRRIALLQLAHQYGFILFEDDYDYDFHYENKPLLPLASVDPSGMVIYSGSFSKIISPAFRVGYLVGPEDLIAELSLLRRIIDRQGDSILENAIAELLQNGIIQKHLRKSLRMYRERRNVFCELLNGLQNYVDYKIPEGGMAIWAKFDPAIDLHDLSAKALKKGLYFSNGNIHAPGNPAFNCTRLGFASSTPDELEKSMMIMSNLLKAR
ncbi:MocR-like pyridoxine biosynthesis transcription factor PdxR [Pedobacter duraquae]|uniref:GntR family transcriptional regulator/MocR family aminotransferase n=1 Tax=Pedobacter duraquae TaxID=425511 RepID=A0A4R6IQM9_9SPHI|nr:PLP-dependent aminotransferase family protein [Pedobacter duraquae]TDO24660.1 GntR family transcriptional regulator/MocR family aminotransferase [Pedobacter duraquae]